jgi:uncharacterized membrane protein YhaH (DUF805 family)
LPEPVPNRTVTGVEITPAGWYPDPSNPLQERLWDGTAWTEHVRTRMPSPPPPPLFSTVTTAAQVPTSRRDSGPVASVRQVVSFDSGNIFKGRISRSAIAWWLALMILVRIALGVVANAIDSPPVSLVAGILSLTTFAVTVSAWVRRLHDSGKSGKHLFWVLVPVIGWVYLIFLASRRGDAAANAYGPAPL